MSFLATWNLKVKQPKSATDCFSDGNTYIVGAYMLTARFDPHLSSQSYPSCLQAPACRYPSKTPAIPRGL